MEYARKGATSPRRRALLVSVEIPDIVLSGDGAVSVRERTELAGRSSLRQNSLDGTRIRNIHCGTANT